MVRDQTLKQVRKQEMIFRSKSAKKLISKAMYRLGVKPNKIARIMNVSRATVYRYFK